MFGVEAPYGVYTFITNYLGALTSKNLARIPDCESWLLHERRLFGVEAPYGVYTYTSNYLGAMTSKNLTFIPGGESR
ncbi:MAG: hypothetical protein LHW51_03480, partial [Candidatus Cloacimonetes bacterium]|nr:hypothetical protein [Candidatus Cloacimonadota bacterium]MCK9243619.1 hypothetical protein [Candidatus Cloacimonadota bacterium]